MKANLFTAESLPSKKKQPRLFGAIYAPGNASNVAVGISF